MGDHSTPDTFLRSVEDAGNVRLQMVGTHSQTDAERVTTKVYAVIPRERRLNDVALGRAIASSLPSGTFTPVSATGAQEAKADVKSEVLFVVDESLASKEETELSKQWWVAASGIVEAAAGDRCPANGCDGTLVSQRGMEVGHAFYLGTKYSSSFNAGIGFGKERSALEMGCYGLGTSRIISAAVEHTTMMTRA